MPTARQLRLAGLVAVGLLIAVGTCSARKNDLATPGARAAYGPRSASADAGGAQFVDVAEAAGFRHTHHKPVLDHKLDNIMAWVCSVGAAAAAGDFDRDGWLDLYVTDSRKGTPNYLYRNNGDGTFTDVAAAAGVADLNGDNGTSMDCIWADYDNDGWIDLYVVLWGRDVLLRNNSDGTFSDVTAGSFRRRDGTPGTNWANGNAVIAFDYNLDGRLDFYVGNYFAEIDLWHLESTRIMHEDFEQARNGGNNYLYRQETDGTFTEVAESIGLDDPGWTLAVGAADLDNDGWPDLYCADDFGPDQLFINNRDGTFANATESAIGFDTKKGMNVDFGDFNNDGWLDIYVANITTAEYLQEGNMLWHNNGPGPDGSISLVDVSLGTGTFYGGWGWGAKFFDYDHDADLDIVAVNGFISAGEGNYWYDLASWTVLGQDAADAANWPAIGDRSFSGYEPIRLWRNDGVYSFTEQSVVAGLDSTRDGRGLISFDYDNDGDLDLFIANQDQPPHLYRNQSPADRHWLMVQLETDPATKVNRDGVGTRVTLVTDGGMQIAERDGGNGYSGQSDPRLHFGLAGEDRVSLVEIRWPDGGLQYLENVAADQVVTVRQDS
ncbi:MAG: CRTAC1 family protein, partial [bacterium]|nr:CRTAC1 family protein [bacterium]